MKARLRWRNSRLAWLLIMLAVLASPAPALAWSEGEILQLVAGGGEQPDGSPAVSAALKSPFGVDFTPDGSLIFVELTGERVRKIDRAGILSTIGGTGVKGDGGDGGPAREAAFNGMHSLVVLPAGDIVMADTWNNKLRKIDPRSGLVSTFAGTGRKGFGGDGGPATKADFGGIYCVARDPSRKHLYLADLDNRRIRAIDLETSIVTTVAGNGAKGVPQDGAKAVEAPLVDPRAVAADAQGRVYILERGGHALRVVKADGTIETLVGTGKPGDTGDGGDARQATMNGPKHLCLDFDGNLLIADTENHRVRKYLMDSRTIVPIAGSGRRGKEGVGGPPLQAQLFQPHGVTVHSDGTLYISDSGNNRILKIARPRPTR